MSPFVPCLKKLSPSPKTIEAFGKPPPIPFPCYLGGDREGDKQEIGFRGQKGTFPDYNKYPGMKRGQSPVVPFFRGGEGDDTFNGFVLSSLELIVESIITLLLDYECSMLVQGGLVKTFLVSI